MCSQHKDREQRKNSPGNLYTKRLGRTLKAHRRHKGVTRKLVKGRLLDFLRERGDEPGWDQFRALVDRGVIELEERGLAGQTVYMPDVQLLADAYHIPELMLDPARSKPVERSMSIYGSPDFLQLEQEDALFYGDGTQYFIPESQICETESIAIVRLRLDGGEMRLKQKKDSPAHSDSHSHPGEEILFVEDGELEMRFVESGLYTRLGKEDFIHFDASLGHGAWNLSPHASTCSIVRFYRPEHLSHRATYVHTRTRTSNTAPSNDKGRVKQREVLNRRAFASFLKLLNSDRFRGSGRKRSLSELIDRAKEKGSLFSRSKLDRIQRGQTRVLEDELPELAEIYDIEPIALYDFLVPDFNSAVSVHGLDDMNRIEADFLPEGVSYWLPRRRLGSSKTMIAVLTLEPNCATRPNRHPGQEIISVLGGDEVELQLGAERAKVKKGCLAHYWSYSKHSVQNVGDKPAKILCMKMIC